MRLATVRTDGGETACLCSESGLVPLASINRRFDRQWPVEMLELIRSGGLYDLLAWVRSEGGWGTGPVRRRRHTVGIGPGGSPCFAIPERYGASGSTMRAHAADPRRTAADGPAG